MAGFRRSWPLMRSTNVWVMKVRRGDAEERRSRGGAPIAGQTDALFSPSQCPALFRLGYSSLLPLSSLLQRSLGSWHDK
ncbi:hypothetical protein P3T25_001544 [Paraburkholderia sp. GAS32]